MSTPIGKYFVDDITVVTTNTDEYGDKVYASQITVKGRILEHRELFLNDRNEQETSDAIAWLPAGTSVHIDDILSHTSGLYRVERFINAKKGMHTTIEFIKCYLEANKSITGIS